MEAVEAVVVVGVSATADGTQEVELEARFPAADFERANVVVSLPAAPGRLQPGDKAVVEFFYPGEQARAHCAGGGPLARVKPPTAPGFCLP